MKVNVLFVASNNAVAGTRRLTLPSLRVPRFRTLGDSETWETRGQAYPEVVGIESSPRVPLTGAS